MIKIEQLLSDDNVEYILCTPKMAHAIDEMSFWQRCNKVTIIWKKEWQDMLRLADNNLIVKYRLDDNYLKD